MFIHEHEALARREEPALVGELQRAVWSITLFFIHEHKHLCLIKIQFSFMESCRGQGGA